MVDFDDLIRDEDNDFEESEVKADLGGSYLQNHLSEIQSYLNDEIVTRKATTAFLGILLAQSANYTFSLILISSGAEFFSSTIIGLIIGLAPGIADISQINQKSENTLERYVPVLIKSLIALFTSGIIFTQITLPHMASRQVLSRIYNDIETIERGKPKGSLLGNLINSPVTPIAVALLLYSGFSTLQSKD